MIVMFRGTKVSKNMAPQILSIYATVNAVKFNRRTLVLQFMSEFPVEKILRGKRDEEEEVMDHNRYQFNDSGIDSLLRKIENQKLEKENFDLACKAMLRTENLLDVAEVSGKEDFIKEIVTRQAHVSQLLEYASEVYDDIYLLGNGKNEELMKTLNPLVQLSIICVPQGNKEEVLEPVTLKDEEDPTSGNDVLYLVTEFDRRSSFDLSKLKKTYEVKRMTTMPYNTGFKDAYNSHNVLAFTVSNTDVKEHDANYDLFNEIFNVHKLIMKNEEPEEQSFDIKKLEREIEEVHAAENKVLDASNVRYTKKYTGFLFWRKETNGYEVTLDTFDDEGQPKRLTGPVKEPEEEKDEDKSEEEYEEYDFNEEGDFEDSADYEEVSDEDEKNSSIDEIDDMVWDDDEEPEEEDDIWEEDDDPDDYEEYEEEDYEEIPAAPPKKKSIKNQRVLSTVDTKPKKTRLAKEKTVKEKPVREKPVRAIKERPVKAVKEKPIKERPAKEKKRRRA